jgi:hypothetical protein
MEEIQIAAGLAMDTDRTLEIALVAQTKAFSLEPVEMEARINKILSRLISKPGTRRTLLTSRWSKRSENGRESAHCATSNRQRYAE